MCTNCLAAVRRFPLPHNDPNENAQQTLSSYNFSVHVSRIKMATCKCVMQQDGNSGVSGSLKITQASDSSSTIIEGQISGLTPGQKHGISVCTYGDLSEGSASCGTSFNPFGTYICNCCWSPTYDLDFMLTRCF